jgi:REP element-mobilizing transposase RayT
MPCEAASGSIAKPQAAGGYSTMPRPLVIAHHLVWTGYGWWMPNDPRGSMSHKVASDVIAELGELHYGRRKVQPPAEVIREFHHRAEDVLTFPLLEFARREVEMIAESFSETITEHRYTCYACAIMPDHVHLLIRKHKHKAEQMIAFFQQKSRLRLRTSAARTPDHPIWGGPGWKAFLDHPDAVRRTIRYIEDNPCKLRLPRQQWPFVTPYDGWPLHPGHSPNSPYAKRLRQ